jgi:hypothetical protein
MAFACGNDHRIGSHREAPGAAFAHRKRGPPQRDLPFRFGWIIPKRRVRPEDFDGERFRTDPSDSLRNLPQRSELHC